MSSETTNNQLAAPPGSDRANRSSRGVVDGLPGTPERRGKQAGADAERRDELTDEAVVANGR
jgi:hypothetical protein